MIKPMNQATFENLLITTGHAQMPEYSDFISFSKAYPITDACQFEFSIKNSVVIAKLAEYGIIGEMKRDSFQIDIKQKPYTCPAC